MSTKIDSFKENDEELERLKLLAKKNVFPFLKPNDEQAIKENMAAIKRMPESERKRLAKFFLEQMQKHAKIFFHNEVKSRFEELEKLPIKKGCISNCRS